MNDVTIMCIVQSHEKLASDFSHDRIGKHLVLEPYPEAMQCLANQLKHKTDMVSIGAPLLKIIYKMADMIVAGMGLVCLSKMRQNLPLVDRPVLTVALGA
jgi:hypothetical protein